MRNSKKLRFNLLFLLLLSVCFSGCMRSSLTINADKSYDGRTLTLHIGDGVRLSLAENPTTGYRWNLVTVEGLEQVESTFEGGGVPGAAGVRERARGAVPDER